MSKKQVGQVVKKRLYNKSLKKNYKLQKENYKLQDKILNLNEQNKQLSEELKNKRRTITAVGITCIFLLLAAVASVAANFYMYSYILASFSI